MHYQPYGQLITTPKSRVFSVAPDDQGGEEQGRTKSDGPEDKKDQRMSPLLWPQEGEWEEERRQMAAMTNVTGGQILLVGQPGTPSGGHILREASSPMNLNWEEEWRRITAIPNVGASHPLGDAFAPL